MTDTPNKKRASWAGHALQAYMDAPGIPLNQAPPSVWAANLITDLMHFMELECGEASPVIEAELAIGRYTQEHDHDK